MRVNRKVNLLGFQWSQLFQTGLKGNLVEGPRLRIYQLSHVIEQLHLVVKVQHAPVAWKTEKMLSLNTW